MTVCPASARIMGSSIATINPGRALRAQMQRRCSSTARRAMASPSPEPPLVRLRCPSTRKNGLKIEPSASSGSPGPRSRTTTEARPTHLYWWAEVAAVSTPSAAAALLLYEDVVRSTPLVRLFRPANPKR